MKFLTTERFITIPEGVTVEIKARKVRVTGPRGMLYRELKHVNVEFTKIEEKKIRAAVYHGQKKHLACLRTVCAHVENMVKGVTRGFEYKLRFVYAHFPINVSIVDDDKTIEIRNFLGEKIVRRIPMLEGCTIRVSENQKDEIIIIGNDLDCVSQSAASIQQSTAVKNKDIRKFLDGIYVSEKGMLPLIL